MRWNDLFADLEGQLSAAASAQFKAEVSELTRAERAQVDLAARVMGNKGDHITVAVGLQAPVKGVISDAAAQWMLITSDARQYVIPMAAVQTITGLSAASIPVSDVERKLSLGHVLRALSRDRARVVVATGTANVSGLIASVGADHFDVATTVGDGQRVTVPFHAVAMVRSVEI